MGELHEAHVEEHEAHLEKEKKRFLGQIKKFEEELIPLIDDFFSSESEDDFKKIQSLLGDLDFLGSESYLKLSKQEQDPQFIHDLTFFASPTNGFRNLLLLDNEFDLEKIKKQLKFFYENSLPYSMIMEGLLSRDKNDNIRDGVKRRVVNLENMSTCLSVLSESGAMKFLIKEKFKFKEIDPRSLLQEDEEVITVPGVIVNSLMNMVRNSCAERSVATIVEVDVEREGDLIVFRVIDNGKGMAQQHLEKGHSDAGYIFDKGKKSSGTGSTGLGLANLDKRITSLDGILRVASKRKLPDVGYGEQVNFTTETGEEKLPDIELQKNQSTIFEIHLPITKKK
ncbi:hypothetical protein KJ785_03375 [Patescibacteria group bacterium]|nr:hypothetical protein [Patescibacteria group bacterium]